MSKIFRILVVDDDRRMAKTLTDILRAKGYDAESAHSGSEALEQVSRRRYDAVIADIKMLGMNGAELTRAIKKSRPLLPVLLMTAYATDGLIKEGLAEGALAWLEKPLDINLLLSLFTTLRKENFIVIVDDDPQFCRTLGDILKARGVPTRRITDPHQAMERIDSDVLLVILDMKLNDLSGFDVLRGIRKKYPEMPVILVTGFRGEMASAIEKALEIDAFPCFYKPIQMEAFFKVITEIQQQELGKTFAKRLGKRR